MNERAETAVDPFATFDAAYVLGSLSPEDRAAFEQHLRHCDACARSVRELAGLPGLLAQVDDRHQLDPPPPPPELLPRLLARVRALRRRRLVAGVAAVVVAVAACVAVVLAVVLPPEDGVRGGSAMTPLGAYPVSASVNLTEAAWGTRVDMSCSYEGGRGGDYVLVAVRRDGTEEQLASWQAVPRNTAELSIGTPLRTAEIDALEIRVPGGPVLLRLPVTG
ncbi:anti-sigma factor family protein [Prauserella muralis]|uniref:Anti-sigma factor n=1 Tax=Prauserella muralis TaxID=588067 RepID=A0A2V4AI06_9PSEU|nr:zf-HC2 domain-containing protein [Prauserella muralis]PXY19200.1 anti-sigma factor [Prauserella muralis]TWE29121.1 putative zinc finger protein [Prauserella muralis]